MGEQMAKYLFIGGTDGNTGPSNVNKGIVKNLTSNFYVADSKNKVAKYMSAIVNTFRCKVVVVSGMSKVGTYAIKLAKLLNKKTIYIMHGCYEIETALNEATIDAKNIKMEQYILHSVDLLLPVSERYSQLVQDKYPFCKEKTAYLHNGVEKIEYNYYKDEQIKGRIIAVGGDRKLKNNITVAKAVAQLDDSKKLMVYGHLYHPENLHNADNIEFKGLVSQEQLYNEMSKSELYVLNSVYEPFALSVFDALLCGCSILVTNRAGALELLNVTEHDVIKNPMDEDEIAGKINYLLKNPNNSRLMSNLDFEKISYKAEVKKLEQFCRKLSEKTGDN